MPKLLFPFLFLLLCIISPTAGLSQDFDNYKPLKCAGTIPKDFLIYTKDKVQSDINTIDKKSKQSEKGAKQEFLLISNYEIDQVLLSGKVVFGDPVTQYVNKVGDEILKNAPELRKKIRFYVLKTTECNAFATNQGIVFVTLGLLSQLNNESELAYVLCHEMVHYIKQHPINSYVKQDEEKNKGRHLSVDDQLKTMSKYSRELELQADSMGLRLFLTTGYARKGIISMFDVLLYSDLPFDEVPFEKNFLENTEMKIPRSLSKDTFPLIKARDLNYDDSRHSHPNLKNRIDRLMPYLSEKVLQEGNAFLVSETDFLAVRETARFEVVKLNLEDAAYCEALYNSRILLKTHPSSVYLKTCVAKALYGLAKCKINYNTKDVMPHDYKDYIEGNLYSVYFLFKEIEPVQAVTLAFRYIYIQNKELKSAYLDLLLQDLSVDLSRKRMKLDDFRNFMEEHKKQKEKIKPNDTTGKSPEVPPNDIDTTTKTGKIRYTQRQNRIKDNPEVTLAEMEQRFHLLAFYDFINDPELEEYLKNGKKEFDRRNNDGEETDYVEGVSGKKRKEIKVYDVKKIVVVDPFYYKADERKGLKLIDSENELLELNDQVISNAALAGLPIDLLSSKLMDSLSVERFNDMVTFLEWSGEINVNKDSKMIPIHSEEVIPLIQKYETEHVCFTGIITVKEVRRGVGLPLFYSIFFPPILPVMIAWAASPQHETMFYTMIYDLKTGKLILDEAPIFMAKAKNGNINSLMYDLFLRIKN